MMDNAPGHLLSIQIIYNFIIKTKLCNFSLLSINTFHLNYSEIAHNRQFPKTIWKSDFSLYSMCFIVILINQDLINEWLT